MPVVQSKPNLLVRAAFPLLLIFLFAIFSGLPEFVGFLRPVRPMLVLGILGMLAVALSGRLLKVAMSPVGKMLCLFTFWFLLCIPLAIWRGGSFSIFMDDWSKSFMAFFLTAGLISSVLQLKKAFHAIAYATGLLAILALLYRSYDVEGRLGMPGGRYAGANEFGVSLLFGLIFLGYTYVRGDQKQKILAAVLSLPVVFALSKTGSRGALLGAGILFLYVFFHVSALTRMKLLCTVPVVFVVLAAMAPATLRERYTTLFRPKTDTVTRTEAEAADSARARLTLFKDSVTLTLQHPLVGVGPGNFMVAQQALAIARGEPYGLWHVTHNSYTQISSEMGIPALVIYLGFIFTAWISLSAIIKVKTVTPGISFMAHTTRAALLIMATVAIFGSIAYNVNMPILAGLIVALGFVAADQRVRLKKKQREQAAAQATLAQPVLEPAWSSFPD